MYAHNLLGFTTVEYIFIMWIINIGTSLIAQLVKNLPEMQETPVPFLGREDLLEKE